MALEIMFDQFGKFIDRVGVLYPHDYPGMPIQPLVPPVYWPKELDMLVSFVREFQEYHIVSITCGGRMCYNRFVESANHWMLADGDANPDLVLVRTNEVVNGGRCKPIRLRTGAERGRR